MLGYSRHDRTFFQKLKDINFSLIFLVTLIAAIGFSVQYSVADGSFEPWAGRQILRFGAGLILLIAVATVDIRIWLQVAYPFYALSLVLLLVVEVAGRVGMGAQRWIDLGIIQLQPAELLKISLIMALARFFHGQRLEDTSRILTLLVPLAMISIPAVFLVRQPDLGTALLISASGITLIFLAGAAWRYFIGGTLAFLAAIPIGWQFLHEFQRERVLVFLDPSRDPLGAGYHITQSKIALGSGGVFGKGFMEGTQSQLNFLPEKQTDFIFTAFAEEFGLLGGLTLLFLYALVLLLLYAMATQVKNQFGRLMVLGVATTFFLYIFINIAMVMGIVPVVGEPLPFVSYGGTSMIALLMAFGLVMSAYVHREIEIPRRPSAFG